MLECLDRYHDVEGTDAPVVAGHKSLNELIAELCPDGVEYKPLRELASIRGRIGFRGYKRSDLVVNGGAYAFSPADIVNGKLFTSCAKRISMDKYDESPEIQVSAGDVLIAKTASIGKVAAVRMLDDVATINPQLVVLKDISCDYLYLTNVLQSNPIQRELSRIACGAIPNISQKNLGLVCIPVPPIEVQREIVRILDEYTVVHDELVSKLEQRVELYQQQKKTVLEQAFELDDCPVISLAELEDSGQVKLGRGKVISKRDVANNPGNYPIYSSSATNNGLFGRYGAWMFDDARITWSIDGGGRFFYRDGSVPYSVTNVCGWLLVETSSIDTKYLYYALWSSWVKKSFDYAHKAHPSVVRREYKIPIPSLGDQRRIVEVLDGAMWLHDGLIDGLNDQIKDYDQQLEVFRNGLLTFRERSHS